MRPNGITDREKSILVIVWHFIADTDTKNLFRIYFLIADAETAVLCSLDAAGSIADKNDFGHNL